MSGDKNKKVKKISVKSVRTVTAEENEKDEQVKRERELARGRSKNGDGALFSGDARDSRAWFLRGISLVYFIAFLSIYVQIEGLYGSNGITPAKAELKLNSRTPMDCLKDKMTLICFLAPELGLEPHYVMELIALVGIVLSGMGTLCVNCCVAPIMFILWLGYYSIYQVGGVFLWFQWDILLLEAGILAVLAAPWFFNKGAHEPKPRDLITMWLVQWLLFRLMFASGVVKLQSGCPTWWGLDALQYHFQSQCLPTSLAYYAHHLPGWILRLMVVGTYFVEILVPILFFSPFTFLRRISFWIQVLFQLSIIATGNYNFFNLLTIVLCFSLLDSNFFSSQDDQQQSSILTRMISRGFQFVMLGLMISYTMFYFGFTMSANYTSVESKTMFTRGEFDQFISYAVPYSLALGFVSLASKVSQSLVISMFDMPGCWRKFTSLSSTLFYGFVCFTLFAVTCVPFTTVHPETNKALWPAVKQLHGNLSRFHVTSSYGLFRRMTGTEKGRPEVILEYSEDIQGPWKEYSFMYKPGDLSAQPVFVAPHQPRLDWQMWFAALGTYHDNPWLVSLAYRLLQGEQSVQNLLGPNEIQKNPPKYIRASLYQYTFTDTSVAKNWWTRDRSGEYMPIFSATHPPLVDFIKKLGYLEPDLAKNTVLNHSLKNVLDSVRSFTKSYRPEYIIWSSLLSFLLLIITSKLF